ncbi:MAG TPA: DUF47 domain-containing protein [Opitutaceae bacterium]|jgi:hypothetical protein|nr:DUF47 domain-containing protein [Opitutaceae bacterium]
MFSLQKLFSRDDLFFELLEASADECRASVTALRKIVGDRTGQVTLDEFAGPRRREKQINVKIAELMARVSVTSLEREDIEALANAFYKIPKTLEKFAERYILAAPELQDVDFARHVQLLDDATAITVEMIKQLRKSFDLEKTNELNGRLQAIESEADKLILDLVRTELYSRRHDALKVIILKDLYELLEKGVDRCRDAGNVVCEIVLKNS